MHFMWFECGCTKLHKSAKTLLRRPVAFLLVKEINVKLC